jgi:hypothetical protein
MLSTVSSLPAKSSKLLLRKNVGQVVINLDLFLVFGG